RERPSREKMFLGAPVMIALVGDGGDDGGLAVAPAVAGDACALADRRMRAIGRDKEARGERIAVGQTHMGVLSRKLKIGDRCVPPSSFAFAASAASNGPFSTMWANGSPGSTSPSKLRKTGRTTSARRLSVTTISRMGCASMVCQTPMVLNRRRAAATMADARP